MIGVPAWLQEAVRTEYYIKTGLVIMGATILFQEIMTAGALGMLQAVAVVIVVWYFSFWLAKRLRLDDEFAAILSSAVSICGVSAAIATCGAIQGDRRKLSYVASVVLIVAVPMIVIQPWIIRWHQHAGCCRRSLARRYARHDRIGCRGRRLDQRDCDEDRDYREVLSKRTHWLRGVLPVYLVDDAPARSKVRNGRLRV